MKTVRRLYFYAVALISIELVVWGLINLLRSMLSDTVGGTGEVLARALALTLVGLPIFLFHWAWAQRLAAADNEERTASVRAVFFYGMLLATLIPAVQNVLALLNRLLLAATGLSIDRAFLGSSGTVPDNLIAIVINGLVALYFWSVLREDWVRLPERENHADVRRLYRYVWVLYGLLMTVFGAQQMLRFIIFVPTGMLGEMTRETLINGLALLLVGTPVWVYAWNIAQRSLDEPAERDSNLRLTVLYFLALGGVITVLTAVATVLHTLIDIALGVRMTFAEAVDKLGGPISIGLPLAAVWAYYGGWLARQVNLAADPVRRLGMKRIYKYILSALGLGGTLLGTAMLLQFVIDVLLGGLIAVDDALRSNLGRAIGIIAAWLPLWLIGWRRAQDEAAAAGDQGDHARRSIVRRAYLYLAIFAGVVGGMVSAVGLVFELLQTALTAQRDAAFLNAVLNSLQLLVLFIILLAYHLSVLRGDGRSAAAALARKHRNFRVLVVDSPKGFGPAARSAMARLAPDVPTTVATRQPRGRFDALLISGSSLLTAPQWVRSFGGARIVVPDASDRLHWAGGLGANSLHEAAVLARRLAEGQSASGTRTRSGWLILVYVAAGLFGLELLAMLISALLSTFMR